MRFASQYGLGQFDIFMIQIRKDCHLVVNLTLLDRHKGCVKSILSAYTFNYAFFWQGALFRGKGGPPVLK